MGNVAAAYTMGYKCTSLRAARQSTKLIVFFLLYGSYMMQYHNYWNACSHVLPNSSQASSRPHWGEEFYVTTKQLKKVYPKLEDFLVVRSKLDPDGLFVNPINNWNWHTNEFLGNHVYMFLILVIGVYVLLY